MQSNDYTIKYTFETLEIDGFILPIFFLFFPIRRCWIINWETVQLELARRQQIYTNYWYRETKKKCIFQINWKKITTNHSILFNKKFFSFVFTLANYYFDGLWKLTSSGTTEGRQKFVPFTKHSSKTTLQVFKLAAAYRSRYLSLSLSKTNIEQYSVWNSSSYSIIPNIESWNPRILPLPWSRA